MKIGIDIDDVITDSSTSIAEYLKKYEASGDGIKYFVEVMKGEIPTENIKKFFDNYICEICKNVRLKDDKIRLILEELIDKKNEIYLITSRGEIRFKGTEKVTMDYLKKYNLNYTQIVFNAFEKDKICKELGIDIMVDDSVINCESVKKNGIKSIVFTTDVNKEINTEIERVDSWEELRKKIIDDN